MNRDVERKSSHWTRYLEGDEALVVENYQAKLAEIDQIRRESFALKAEYNLIQNRCVQRRRYRQPKQGGNGDG